MVSCIIMEVFTAQDWTMLFINIFINSIYLLALIPVVFFCLQIVFAWRAKKTPALQPQESPENYGCPDTVVLIPAHNEASVIEQTLRSLYHFAEIKIMVIADNCDDETASVVQSLADKHAKISLVERTDPQHRGKNFALDFGLRQLAQKPPEVVIFMDADCELEQGDLQAMASHCHRQQQVLQALYLMHGSESGIRQKIAVFAWRVKNQVRALGSWWMGVPCQLMGSGMAFPWTIVRQLDLKANTSLVEDLVMGLELVKQGIYPVFHPQVCLSSSFPQQQTTEKTQRKRWEHGHIATIVNLLPRLFVQAIKRRDSQLFLLCLDVAIPPLALFSLLQLGLWMFAAVLWLTSGMEGVLWISTFTISLLIFAVLFAWHHFAKDVLKWSDFIYIPIYILKKIPLYLAFLYKREQKWIKTRRD